MVLPYLVKMRKFKMIALIQRYDTTIRRRAYDIYGCTIMISHSFNDFPLQKINKKIEVQPESQPS